MKIDRNFIAEKAGVSSATVSRVFNDPKLVAPDKVEQVLAAAKKYGYSPNKMASALRRNGTGIISFVESTLLDRAPITRNYHWCFTDSVKGAKFVIDKSMYHFNLLNMNASNFTGLLKTKFCDGMMTMDIPRVFAEKIKASGIPYVLAFREKSEKFNTVYIDEREGGRLAGELFVRTGHKGFAHITSNVRTYGPSEDRYRGFKEAIGGEPLLIDGAGGIKGGFESAKKIIKEPSKEELEKMLEDICKIDLG